MTNKYFNYLGVIIIAATIPLAKTFGQSKEIPREAYLASGIPDSLKEGANSVVRYSATQITVKANGTKTVRHKEVVTILNEKGDHEAVMAMEYNKKYDTYSAIEMRVFDQAGSLLKKYHKSDMYDGAVGDDETLVTDDRFLAVKHTIAAYPVTIEQEYEEDVTSSVNLGRWDIQKNEQAVQNAEYFITIDPKAGFRYMNKNIGVKPIVSTADNMNTYLWQVANLKAFKIEEGAEAWRVLPRINFATNNFQFYGLPGDFSSWETFGKWIQSLNTGGISLTPEREAEIQKMTDTIKTDKAKAKFLYNYMQQNMRYVSVQLGIGGLKPFPATFVDQKKYGDCKALANYMSALLKAVKIPSCYAIINAEANKEPADPKFPYNYFNHVILCIPFKGDTTWLECTSSTQPFGKLGSFTENRNALLITDDGGKLVKTPGSKAQDNQFNSEVHLTLDADGGAKANVKILCEGEYRSDYIGILSRKLDEQKETVMHMLNIRQPSVFDINPTADKDGTKEVDLSLEYDKFVDIMAGDKQFYRPRVFDLCAFTVPVEEKRKSDYYFDIPMQKTCVTSIDLPAGFTMETLPVDQNLKFTYGNYEVKYVYDAAKNQVVSTAKFNLTNQVIPAAKYTEMQQYLDAVAKAQNKKMVIRRKA